MWFNKKKKSEGPIVWMIQKKGIKPEQFLGVCKSDLITLGNWKGCFRYSDIDSAGLMIYWLIQSGKIKPNDYEAVPVQLNIEGSK